MQEASSSPATGEKDHARQIESHASIRLSYCGSISFLLTKAWETKAVDVSQSYAGQGVERVRAKQPCDAKKPDFAQVW